MTSQDQGQTKMQTFGEAESSITGTLQSSFSSLAKTLGIPQLKESFYQNIIYIFIMIVIMVGILVYIQITSITSTNPLFAPPTKEVKKVEIKRIVEGFDANVDFGVDTAAPVDGNDDNNVNGNGDDELYHAYDDTHDISNGNKKNKK